MRLAAGTSELSAGQQEDLQAIKQMLKTFRRKSVSCVALPCVGGASGADFSKAQLEHMEQHMWESLRFGHRFALKKAGVRAFVFPAG